MTDGQPERALEETGNTVRIGERLMSSAAFKTLFREGMALVEETAAYLDGPGRTESRDLDRSASLAYATESMRLTTRLMQLASWLLLQRAVNEGEMSREQALAEKTKVTLAAAAPQPDDAVLAMLPPRLVELVGQSVRLQTRLRLIETAMVAAPPAGVPDRDNAVGRQMDRLRQAFSPRD